MADGMLRHLRSNVHTENLIKTAFLFSLESLIFFEYSMVPCINPFHST